MTDQNNLPEAVASVTYSITSEGGFNALFTIRGTSGKDLLETMADIEKVLVAKKYKPQVKQSFGQKKEVEYIEGKKCPNCGGRVIAKVDKNGKNYEQCEFKHWDFVNKRDDGKCSYRTWPNANGDYSYGTEPI